jgi:antitoxin YefM
MTYSDARKNLKKVMDRVVDDCSETIITRRNGGAVVMISLDDWNSMEETLHLLSNPKNAQRLRESIRELEAGKGTERELVQP